MGAALRDWLRRASRHVTAADAARALLPPAYVAGALRLAAAHRRGRPPPAPDARDPEFVRVVAEAARWVGARYFRWEVRGIEHVPAAGPALLVGSHNGGLLSTDILLTFAAIWERFGPDRALVALGHDLLFDDPTLCRWASRLGAVRATPENGARALSEGRLVLVYPGSDVESFRPWRERGRVTLGGRTGYMALALRARVPLVPVVSAGTHEQLVVLARGARLARALGLRRWLRTGVCPLVLALPWGLTSGFLPYLPLPAQTTLAFGPPVRFDGVPAAAADDPVVVARCHATFVAAMQATLDGLTAGRVPLLGQRRRAPPPGCVQPLRAGGA